MPRAKSATPDREWYAGKLGSDNARKKSRAQDGRDVAPIPDIESVRRRARCRGSLKLFCETYNPESFPLAWSQDHLRAIARIEEAATRGALYAFAMARGSGKTTICRMGALWAVSYAFCRYVFCIGANAGKAEDTLDAIKKFVRFLPKYAEDFPEIAHPARALKGIANRASGQVCGGEPTMIEWSKDCVVLPTVPPPGNWPKSWPLRDDGMAPTSGAVISAAGLTSDGIRGSLLTLTTGESIRPDLVLLDDPQTPESARSPTQNVTREQLVSADVLGMAGPGKTISAVMPCTVIAPGDFIDRILDRSKHPLWRGERSRMLRSMPSDMGAWDDYFEVYKRCWLKEPPDFAEASRHFEAHRGRLEAGAEASWPERKLPWEASAVHHAMNLYCRDPVTWMAEYQNDPRPLVEDAPGELTPAQVACRVNNHGRGVLPSHLPRLTAFVDVQQDLLYYAVCAWGEGFSGAVIDYGAWPGQRRPYFTLREANPTLGDATGVHGLEGSLFAALERLAEQLLGRAWAIDGGGEARIERCLVDANWGASTDVVYRWCRQSAFNSILTPSHGTAISAKGLPMDDWPKKPGERRGPCWIMPVPKPGRGVRHVRYDVNMWKTFLHSRLSTPLGSPGALALFGDRADLHRLLADHVCAEYRVRTGGRGRELDEWSIRPSRPDNHWLDCLAGATVAASMLGVSLEGATPAPQARRRVSFSQMQAEKQARRG